MMLLAVFLRLRPIKPHNLCGHWFLVHCPPRVLIAYLLRPPDTENFAQTAVDKSLERMECWLRHSLSPRWLFLSMSPWPPVAVLYMTDLSRNRAAHEWQCHSLLDGPSMPFSPAFPWPYRRRKWDSQVYNCWGTFCCLSWKLGSRTPSSILREVLQYLGWVWTDVLKAQPVSCYWEDPGR